MFAKTVTTMGSGATTSTSVPPTTTVISGSTAAAGASKSSFLNRMTAPVPSFVERLFLTLSAALSMSGSTKAASMKSHRVGLDSQYAARTLSDMSVLSASVNRSY